MDSPKRRWQQNARVLQVLSSYLNQSPDFIDSTMINEVSRGDEALCELAYASLLAAACGVDRGQSLEDRELFDDYFRHMVHRLDPAICLEDSFCRTIVVPEHGAGTCQLKQQRSRPYEAFVGNDLESMPDGRCLPQIGFFDCEVPYPAILEGDRVWMSVTPNEIETMKPAIAQASGRVLTCGLGLGYYAYMVAEKPSVDAVTVIEQNPEIIHLFETHILPQFPHADKVRVIRGDAFDYVESHLGDGCYDLVFTDLWHDPSDGVALYLRMKPFEKLSPTTGYLYWIETTLLHYC
jgi:hypothetical protein